MSGERESHPEVWAGSWADHNAGVLHGRWIRADQTPEDIWADVQDMLATSTQPHAEEHGWFDYQGFGPLAISEQESVEDISRVGLGIAEHGDAFAHFADVLGRGAWGELDRFDELYIGHYQSVVTYAEELLDDLGADDALDDRVPDWLRGFVRIDVAGFAEAITHDLGVSEDEGGVHLFHLN